MTGMYVCVACRQRAACAWPEVAGSTQARAGQWPFHPCAQARLRQDSFCRFSRSLMLLGALVVCQRLFLLGSDSVWRFLVSLFADRHSRESGNPCCGQPLFLRQFGMPLWYSEWIPVFAGMTAANHVRKHQTQSLPSFGTTQIATPLICRVQCKDAKNRIIVLLA